VRTILMIVLVYYGIKLIFRFLIPYLLKYLMKKQQAHFEGVHRNKSESFQENQTGESNKSDTSKRDNLGEYVDYEEIGD